MRKKLAILTLAITILIMMASCASSAPRNVNYKRHRGHCGSCTKWTMHHDTTTADKIIVCYTNNN